MKRAVVVIPTYNERENIQNVIPKLLDVFTKVPKDWHMAVLVVDDTSPDKTYEAVAALEKKHPGVIHLLINPQKSGLGGAYLKGMAEAFGKLKADIIFEFDADLSHDPTKIPDFIAKIDQGYDLVLGSRYIAGGSIPEDWGFHRKFLSVVGNTIIRVVLGDLSIRDWTTGYRAITKKVYEAVLPYVKSERFTGYTFQIGFLYTTVRLGFSVAEVPFHFVDRTIGSSKLGMEYIKNTLLYIFRVRAADLYRSTVARFLVVGAVAFLIQMSLFAILWRPTLIAWYELAAFLSIEAAVVSNFILNNNWTFSKQKLPLTQVPGKFLLFNFSSGGSILTQMIIAWMGKEFIGLFEIMKVFTYTVNTGHLYLITGVLIGMVLNFFVYSKIIWKKKDLA